jgi:Holliday junction DNA helicase RuvB
MAETKAVPRFHGFIGHEELVAPLRRELDGAVSRGQTLPHLMLIGPSSVGKTRLAEALAAASGTRTLRVMGYAGRAALVKQFKALKAGDFLFIDEAHGLKPADQEIIFEALDHLRVPASPGPRARKRANRPATGKHHRLQPFTLVLATDRPGHLLDALKKRIPTTVDLPFYPRREMREILATFAADTEVLLSPEAADRLAGVCQGLPRKARHLVEKLRLFFPAEAEEIDIEQVDEFLSAFAIDEDGLCRRDHKYLRFLAKNGRASVETLARFLGTDKDEVQFQVEPVLLHRGLVEIGSSGRRLTAKGRQRAGGANG